MRVPRSSALVIMLCVVLLALPGCAVQFQSDSISPGYTPSCPPHICRVVIPPCQPPALVGLGMPRDAVSRLGFRPYVATWLPGSVSWYNAEALPADASSSRELPSEPRPLMRLEYTFNFPLPFHGYAPRPVIAFDETTQALGFTTNVTLPGQTLGVASETAVDINGVTGTLFELQATSGAQTRVIGIAWQVGTLRIRVTAVTRGNYSPSGGVGESIVAWSGTSNDELLRVARSSKVYIGCDSIPANAA